MPKIRREGGATYPIGVIPPGAELVEVEVVLDAEQAEAIAAGAPFVVETVDDEGPDDAPDGPYAGMLRSDLQLLCSGRGLPTSGNKPELIARLMADDAAKAELDEADGELGIVPVDPA